MLKRRVAITGVGVVSPLGGDAESTWQALLAGRSGIGPIEQFDAHAFPTRIAAEVRRFAPRHVSRGKHARFVMPFTQFALDAAAEALHDAAIWPTPASAMRWGVVVGSGMMTCDFSMLQQFQTVCAPHGEVDWSQLPRNATAFNPIVELGKTQSNSGLSLLIQEFGIRGYANSVHTACASGGQALGLGMQVIQRGEADFLLAGGFDSMINPLGVSSFCLLGALSTDNDKPQLASRPFDATRNGFVLGEGSAFLVLEAWEKAVARGARIYAELAGFGNTLSAYRITDSHPNGDGATQAIERALQDAGVKPSEVDYINAHGTSTQMNDLSETNAIKAALGPHAFKIPVSSTKSQTGHLIAAAGALEAVLSVLAMQHGRVPMTHNRHVPDVACDLDYVTDGVREKALGIALSNSFGFGGSNSCLVFKHPELSRER